MQHQELLSRKHWVFDMDGTLTIAQHDFDAIRDELGLPEGLPILESLDLLSEEESTPIHQRLNEIELEIAAESKAAEGAHQLLETLWDKGANIGILTRNNKINISVTLKAAGLDGYFSSENLLSRDCAVPKPAPDGILQLFKQWQAKSDNAVMVGDHLHDLLSGQAAGAKTLYIDPSGEFVYKKNADVYIHQLTELFN
ncbi:MAG: HAD superfamily hydrolase (TIGR01549 family) [Cocleimonas sp.]|jgi:HAD superfamily hydrolase (TIGR01549 family)